MSYGFCRAGLAGGRMVLAAVFLLGATWSSLHAVEDLRWGPLFPWAEGCDGTVYGLASGPDDTVYVGGDFTSCGGLNTQNVAAYHVETDTWTALGNGVNDRVNALAWRDGALYVGGMFTQINGGGAASRMARWDPATSQWSPVGNDGNGVDERVMAMAVMDGDLYVGGEFQTVNMGSNSLAASFVARWDGSQWSALETSSGEGVNGMVWALTADGTRLYVGGDFQTANVGGPVQVNRIAYWENNTWSGLTGSGGIGTLSRVRAIGVVDDDVYVGGGFTEVNVGNPVIAHRIARWDGQDWHALADVSGQGVDNMVNSMTVLDGNVYIGGVFETFGDVQPVVTNRIARWDGSAWHALGSGLSLTGATLGGRALTSLGERYVFVGGQFTSAGGQTSQFIAAYRALGKVEIELVGNGSGTVSGLGGEIDCPGDCSALGQWDAPVDIEAVAAPDSDFAGFSGAGCGSATNCSFDLEQDVTITATFDLKTYAITVGSVIGMGQLTADPSTVEHGAAAGGLLVPDSGWSVYSLAGDTCTPEDNGDGTWQASNITTDCELTVEFRPNVEVVLATGSQPALIGQPVTYTIEVSGSDTAPIDGEVTVLADAGELCLDSGGMAGAPVGNTVTFECQIQYSGTGTRTLTAEYSASSTHMPGTSNSLVQQVVGSFEIFEDRFEVN